MKCVGHPSNTRSLGPPPGWDHEKLPVYTVMVTDVALAPDMPAVATFWKPDSVELNDLMLGGTVMLSVIGPTMPPVDVQVAKATEPHEPVGEASGEELNGGDARCLACGCTDGEACEGGCSWAWVDRETQQGLCSACIEAGDAAGILNGAGQSEGFDPARALNGELRTEMLAMLRCMARGELAERIKDEPLKKILSAIFTELSDADSDAQETPKLRERVEALQSELAAAADAPRQVAALNERLIAANAQIDALQLKLAQGGAA